MELFENVNIIRKFTVGPSKVKLIYKRPHFVKNLVSVSGKVYADYFAGPTLYSIVRIYMYVF